MKDGIIFIGGETSGQLRRRFQAAGYETYSADLLPSQDGGEDMVYADSLPMGRHLIGDFFETLENMWANDLWPAAAIFHPTCTYLTSAAEWAYKDPDFERYPGVGYHQKLKAGTLFGAERREAREAAIREVRRIAALPIKLKAWENPVGVLGTRVMKPSDVVQPYMFGDDASKATCITFTDKSGTRLPIKLKRDPAKLIAPTLRANGKKYWGNQTDTGQNRLSPGAGRWQKRSETYPGIADALVEAVIANLEGMR